MLKTRITEMLDIEYPIIGGCMQWVTVPEFVAAISNAGALGILSSATYADIDEFREAIRKTKELTDMPFGVNLNLFPALRPIENDLYVDVILEEGGVAVVETSGNRPPEELLARLREGGIRLMHKCISVRHALSAQRAGEEAITLFGREGGGHVGNISTIPLIRGAVDALDVPVIAAGGIADGKALAAAFALGAEAAMIGTRLLLTDECPIHDNLKRALIDATEQDTLVVLKSVHNPLRVWKNPASVKANELEEGGAGLEEIVSVLAGVLTSEMFLTGDVDKGVIACSQSIGTLNDVKPVAEVVKGMVEEAKEVLTGLPGR